MKSKKNGVKLLAAVMAVAIVFVAGFVMIGGADESGATVSAVTNAEALPAAGTDGYVVIADSESSRPIEDDSDYPFFPGHGGSQGSTMTTTEDNSGDNTVVIAAAVALVVIIAACAAMIVRRN